MSATLTVVPTTPQRHASEQPSQAVVMNVDPEIFPPDTSQDCHAGTSHEYMMGRYWTSITFRRGGRRVEVPRHKLQVRCIWCSQLHPNDN
jgi:hypothetical protein